MSLEKEMDDNIKILIVDDYDTVRKILKTLLRKLGLTGTIEEAENGNQGFELLEKSADNDDPIEFIFCDVMMPYCDGVCFLKQARSDPRFKKIPVLMLTAEKKSEIIMKCIAAGATGYILKPWDENKIINQMETCWKKAYTIK